jgi:hypothetical protein
MQTLAGRIRPTFPVIRKLLLPSLYSRCFDLYESDLRILVATDRRPPFVDSASHSHDKISLGV